MQIVINPSLLQSLVHSLKLSGTSMVPGNKEAIQVDVPVERSCGHFSGCVWAAVKRVVFHPVQAHVFARGMGPL